MIGPKVDLSYDYEHLGEDASIIKSIMNDSHPFAKKWKFAKKPVIILGSDALERKDGGAILANVQIFARQTQCSIEKHDWKVLNILHKVASQVSGINVK